MCGCLFAPEIYAGQELAMLIMTPRLSLSFYSEIDNSKHSINACQCFEFNMLNDGAKSCGDVYNIVYI